MDRTNKIQVEMSNQFSGKKTMNQPNTLGSISLEGEQINMRSEHKRNMNGSEQQRIKNDDGMLPRFRNASEIGEIRSNSKVQGGAMYDGQHRPKIAMSPQVEIKQKNLNLSAQNSQSKTIGERYSRK